MEELDPFLTHEDEDSVDDEEICFVRKPWEKALRREKRMRKLRICDKDELHENRKSWRSAKKRSCRNRKPHHRI